MSDPRSVAVIGASQDRRKYGNKALRAYLANGWRVFPINPNEASVEGITAFPNLDAVPAPVEVVTMYVPPGVGIGLLPAIAAKKPEEFWLNPGSESATLLAEAERLGLQPILACSIVAQGRSPREFPDA